MYHYKSSDFLTEDREPHKYWNEQIWGTYEAASAFNTAHHLPWWRPAMRKGGSFCDIFPRVAALFDNNNKRILGKQMRKLQPSHIGSLWETSPYGSFLSRMNCHQLEGSKSVHGAWSRTFFLSHACFALLVLIVFKHTMMFLRKEERDS